MKCSIKEALFKEFSSSFSFSLFYYIMTAIILLSINSEKTFIQVVKTSRFAFVQFKKM